MNHFHLTVECPTCKRPPGEECVQPAVFRNQPPRPLLGGHANRIVVAKENGISR
jgi:hypothetical protein